MRLYHLTTNKVAVLIQKNGFKDNFGSYGIFDSKTKQPKQLKGVFFTNCVEIVSGYLFKEEKGKNIGCESVFIVKIPLKQISDYELVEKNKIYREWCIPATIVNKYFVNREVYSIDNEILYKPCKSKIKFSKLGNMTTEQIHTALTKNRSDKH